MNTGLVTWFECSNLSSKVVPRSYSAPACSASTRYSRRSVMHWGTGQPPLPPMCCSAAYLTDLHTCMKMFPLPLFRQLNLKHVGFGLDSEITGELLRRGIRPFEVPVSYVGRSHAQGKQITWRDGFDCLAVLGRVRIPRSNLAGITSNDRPGGPQRPRSGIKRGNATSGAELGGRRSRPDPEWFHISSTFPQHQESGRLRRSQPIRLLLVLPRAAKPGR